ncbi:MAG TPA: DUF4199 domain-containing protein [Hanamia sp.]|jgi:hypothetical protein|nr:DUF4199 domain-containing protein [Hanamia sp.]
MEQTVTTSTTKGIVISLILIVIALITYFLNLNTSSALQYISYLVYVIGIIWSINVYGKQIDHNSTFGNYFAHGFKIAALVTVIMIVYIVIFVMLFPDIREKALEAARSRMVSKGATQDQITQGLNITKKFFMVFIIAGTLIGYLIFGALASLIGAGITKKNPRPIEIDQ